MACFMLLFMVAGFIGSARTAGCKSSTIGREFVFGILGMLDNCCHTSSIIIVLDITNVSPNNTRIRLQIPFFNNDSYIDVPVGATKTISIGNKIQKYTTFKELRGIRITSEGDISVIVTTAFDIESTIDSYNILPISNLGNTYVISSYKGLYNWGSVTLVAGVANKTNITFVNGTKVLRSVVLDLFEVFQFVCTSCDLTGVRVISNRDVYVVSGAQVSPFSGIPLEVDDFEHIAAEMLPTSTWSFNYIVTPVLPKSTYMIRIVADESISSVTVSNISRSYTLNEYLTDQYFETEAVVVTGSKPFSVSQYGVNYDYVHTNGDYFMTMVPGVDQYVNSYTFTVPHGYYGVKSYVSIIVPEHSINDLVLDSHSLKSYNFTRLKVPAPFDNYTIITIPVTEGYHHFYHTNRRQNFGVFVYGHGYEGGYGLSYGFYAGYDLKGECSATDETTPDATIASSPTTFVTSSSQHRGPMCYSCNDLSHIDLCDTVTQCSSQEVCFVERFMDSGQIKYKTGCLQENVCVMKRNESLYSEALCFECCNGDYCNKKGCGENGIPEKERRGPICFDCQHVSSPEECIKIVPCDPQQVCRIEEYKWYDHSHFKLGCGHGLCDPVNRMANHVVKRATPVCHSCCTEDYCNRNCTAGPHGQTGSVIVG